jgi:internalin A
MRKLLLSLILCMFYMGLVSAQNNEQTPYEIALQRIEEARVSGATELVLSALGVTEIPPEIVQLNDLQALYLHENELESLPAEIGRLNNLLRLSLGYNQLSSLPLEIAQLSNLQVLYLNENELENLPAEIGQLSNLVVLSLRDNYLSSLPAEVGHLSNLTTLYLEHNQLSSLPPEIGQLNNLLFLHLNDNQLTSLPPEIGRLEKLCYLNLKNNNFRHLPTTLSKLTMLPVGCNRYDYGLHLDGNSLISPPEEVIAQGTPAILEYLRNEAWWHLQRMIVGGAGAVGLVTLSILGWRWKNRRGKQKRKAKELT